MDRDEDVRQQGFANGSEPVSASWINNTRDLVFGYGLA